MFEGFSGRAYPDVWSDAEIVFVLKNSASFYQLQNVFKFSQGQLVVLKHTNKCKSECLFDNCIGFGYLLLEKSAMYEECEV